MFLTCLTFECKNYLKGGHEWLYFGLFLLLVCAFFNIGFLHEIKSTSAKEGALWVALLLSALLTNGDLFKQDYTDGSLQQLTRHFMGLEQWFLAKMLGQWLITAALFCVMLPLLHALLQIEEGRTSLYGYLTGYWIIMNVCGFAACLSLANYAARYLLPVIILPLVLPVLVFGSGQSSAIAQASESADIFVVGIAILLTPLCLFASGAVLRSTIR